MTRPSIVALARSVPVLLLMEVPARAQAPSSTPYTNTAVDTAHGDREFHLLWPDGAPGAVGTEAVDDARDFGQ